MQRFGSQGWLHKDWKGQLQVGERTSPGLGDFEHGCYTVCSAFLSTLFACGMRLGSYVCCPFHLYLRTFKVYARLPLTCYVLNGSPNSGAYSQGLRLSPIEGEDLPKSPVQFLALEVL